MKQLAINGGDKAVTALPERFHFGAEELAAVRKLFETAITTGCAPGYNGPEEEAFCREFADYLGGGWVDGVNSGTNSLFVALRALDLPPFSEVVVGAITDPGGMMPIVINSLIPVIADTRPSAYNIGPEEVEAVITEQTRAIIVPHIGGEPADIEGIMRVASRYNLPVIEDCAQSHGAAINGRKVGTFGTIGAFSLMFGKHFCTGGQGGALFCRDEELYWRIRRAADRGKPFGLEKSNGNVTASLNCNLDEFGAAIGRAQLRKLPEIVTRRRRFMELLEQAGLGKLNCVEIPRQLPGAESSCWWWRLRFRAENSRVDKLEYCAALAAEGLQLTPQYHALPGDYDWFRDRASRHPWNNPLYHGDPSRDFPCPNAHQAVIDHFNLVVYESWAEPQAEAIAEAFAKVDAAYSR